MISRAIAESLKDNNRNASGFALFGTNDPENPHDRARISIAPVGLKNIGNSCWLNVLIQVCYQLRISGFYLLRKS
jgi:uncharacterized UBP type Zn finger protein